jgi:hypothetical protein
MYDLYIFSLTHLYGSLLLKCMINFSFILVQTNSSFYVLTSNQQKVVQLDRYIKLFCTFIVHIKFLEKIVPETV